MSVLCHICGGHLEVTEFCRRCATPDAPRTVDGAINLDGAQKWFDEFEATGNIAGIKWLALSLLDHARKMDAALRAAREPTDRSLEDAVIEAAKGMTGPTWNIQQWLALKDAVAALAVRKTPE